MNDKPSRALDFFEKVKSEGSPFLRSLVNSDPLTFETDWLDFKGAMEISDKEIKKIWSKALSGFANVEGGVIVWGIDARKDKETQVDCASDFSLVPNPLSFVSRLKELHSQSTDPPIPGVDFWHEVDSPGDESGFVVSYVPESKYKPIRAEAADKNYYIRAGDSFVVPSVALLRNLFFPEYHSRLMPELRVKHDNNHLNMFGYIHNLGIATAKNVTLFINYPESSGWQFNNAGTWVVAPKVHPKLNIGNGLLCSMPIHPGTRSLAFVFKYPLEINDLRELRYGFKVEIFMYCDNNQPLKSNIYFTRENLQDREVKYGITEISEIEELII